jgi:hypothetical protein
VLADPAKESSRRVFVFVGYAAVRASEVDRTSGPSFARAQASRPEMGYSGKRPANRKGGPSELTQASFASVFGEHGIPYLFVTYLAASARRRGRSVLLSVLDSMRASHRCGTISAVNAR